MKMKNTLLSLLITCLYSISVYADDSNTEKLNIQRGEFYLDQSKGVLFEQFSSNTFSLQLLQAKNKFNPYDLVLGGSLEADLQHWQGDTINLTPPGVYQNGGGLYLTQGALDLMGNFTHWSTLFFSVADSHIGRPGDNGNYIYLPHAFIALGNLQDFPIYSTMGISTIPFGVFSGSGTWDTPLTATYFNPIQAPQVSLAYYKNGLNFSATAFSNQVNHDNDFAYSFYYNKSINNFSYSFGSGYITNLKTDSVGNPSVSKPQRVLVITTTDNGITRERERTERRAPTFVGMNMGAVWDYNASVSYRQLTLNGELDRGYQNLQPNQEKPSAFSVAAIYTPNIKGKDTPIGICYSRAFNFKNVPAPLPGNDAILLTNAGIQSVWAASITRPFFNKNTNIGLDLENSTTFFEHHTYTATLDLTTYL